MGNHRLLVRPRLRDLAAAWLAQKRVPNALDTAGHRGNHFGQYRHPIPEQWTPLHIVIGQCRPMSCHSGQRACPITPNTERLSDENRSMLRNHAGIQIMTSGQPILQHKGPYGS